MHLQKRSLAKRGREKEGAEQLILIKMKSCAQIKERLECSEKLLCLPAVFSSSISSSQKLKMQFSSGYFLYSSTIWEALFATLL
jgi:hypothetical protein